MEIQRDFDIQTIPVEGLAAYWLSLKKLVDEKRNIKVLNEEAEYTPEPYIKYLLEIGFSGMPEVRIRSLAAVKRDTLLEESARKYDIMRMAMLDIASGDNPRKTLVKMTAKYHRPPITEKEAFRLAQELAKVLEDDEAERRLYFNVDHRQTPDKLIVTLLFYVIYARKEGKQALSSLLKYVGSQFFGDGMALVVDGFDQPFVRKRLQVHQLAVLAEARHKMNMALELCLALGAKLSYDDIFTVAKAHMV